MTKSEMEIMREIGHECIPKIDIKYAFSKDGWILITNEKIIYGVEYCLFCGVELL